MKRWGFDLAKPKARPTDWPTRKEIGTDWQMGFLKAKQMAKPRQMGSAKVRMKDLMTD